MSGPAYQAWSALAPGEWLYTEMEPAYKHEPDRPPTVFAYTSQVGYSGNHGDRLSAFDSQPCGREHIVTPERFAEVVLVRRGAAWTSPAAKLQKAGVPAVASIKVYE